LTPPAPVPEFTLDEKLRLELEALALREPDNIRQAADSLKGKARISFNVAGPSTWGYAASSSLKKACDTPHSRLPIRGLTQAGKRHAVVRLEPKIDNDTLILSLARDVALEFWKFFSKAEA